MPSLPGFRDFSPQAFAFRHRILSQWRKTVQRYGFVEYDGPPLENLELYTKKSGSEIVGQLYHFTDRGERKIALRPEMTPSLARIASEQHRDYRKPLKWFSMPQVFRYERAQRGRLREHFQLNCDIVGETSLQADAELIALVIDVLLDQGLTQKDFVVRLSDRQFWTDFLKARGVSADQEYEILQAIDKSEREPREKTEEKLGALAPDVFRVLEQGGESERLDALEKQLAARGLQDFVSKDLTVVRGLAYYTGIVFEIFDRQGEFRAIAAGGRYDSLLKQLGGVDLPALGFGMGDVVLGELIRSRYPEIVDSIQPTGVDLYIVIPDEDYREQAIALVSQLRHEGFAVEFPFTAMKMNKQFQAASERYASFALIVDQSWEQGQVGVKDLKARTQSHVATTELISFLGPYKKSVR